MRIMLVLALLGACSKSKPAAPTVASCDAPASHTCEQYESSAKAYLDSRAKDCQQISGTWANAACPTANLVGSCRETNPSWTRTRHYYTGAVLEERTKVECGAFGKWIEPAKP